MGVGDKRVQIQPQNPDIVFAKSLVTDSNDDSVYIHQSEDLSIDSDLRIIQKFECVDTSYVKQS
jgi:hypothetical protein